MRWKVKPKPVYKDGDKKVVTRFAWLPKKIGQQWVWLERYDIIHTYYEDEFCSFWDYGVRSLR